MWCIFVVVVGGVILVGCGGQSVVCRDRLFLGLGLKVPELSIQ
jgi:hypothetical protein